MSHEAPETADRSWGAALLDIDVAAGTVTTLPLDAALPIARQALASYLEHWASVSAAEDGVVARRAFEAMCEGASDVYRTVYRQAAAGAPAIAEVGLVVGRLDSGRPSRLAIARTLFAAPRPDARAIGHDLNNLLTAAVGYSEMLLEEPDHQSLVDDVGQLREALRRAASLVRALSQR